MINLCLCFDNKLNDKCYHVVNSVTVNTQRFVQINTIEYKRGEFFSINPYGSIKSRAQYLRYDIPQRFHFDKMIYFDNDVIVKGDVSELWDINLDDYLIAAVRDPFHNSVKEIQRFQGNVDKQYWDLPVFYSGQLIINCKKFRDENITQQILSFVKEYQCCDMIAMNCVCAGKILELDQMWCAPANYLSENLSGVAAGIRGIDYSKAKLFHFHGKFKPWLGNLKNKTLEQMYLKYL